jgi:hypothetical protein
MGRRGWFLAFVPAAWLSAAFLSGLSGCDDADDGAPARGCDPLAPSYCGFPYPNDYWTVQDPSTPTGKRLALSAEITPVNDMGVGSDPGPLNQADGFSPGLAAMTHMPGATSAGLPTPVTIEASLEDDSPTVILDTVTGRRVGHWAELDQYLVRAKERNLAGHEHPRFTVPREPDELLEERTLFIRPAIRPEDARRYILAIRNVMDESGTPLPPSPGFQALRDGTPSEDPDVERRRAHFEDIFGRLEAAGVPRDNLQLAWDYTTASRESTTRWMVHMRDEALANYSNGVPYRIDVMASDVEEAHTACRLEVTFDMPLYTTHGSAGSTLNFGPDGMPQQNGTFEYAAALIVPLSAQAEPAPLVLYGHGMLGFKEEVVLGFQGYANQANLAMFALDWIGFAAADVVPLVQYLSQGDVSNFRVIAERMHQGFLNFLLAMRTLSREAEGGPATLLNETLATACGGAQIDGSRRYYFGGSQGGILGANIMALSTDVVRGVLAVPGQPYNILNNRSVNFDRFSEIAYPRYYWNALDMQMNLALIQGLWDRAEPTGYSKYIRSNMLPNTPQHEVLLQVSVGDHQVADLGAHIMARTIGAVNLAPAYREIWGIDTVSGPHEGSGMIEMFFGNDQTPIENVPPWSDPVRDPHSRAHEVDVFVDIVRRFMDDGVIENICDGYCTEAD